MYNITDENRCLVYIKISNFDFFIFALEDDFYLDNKHLGFEPDDSVEDIKLSELNSLNVDYFLTKNNKFIKKKSYLLNEFLDFFNNDFEYWDFVDAGLIPKIVIDYNDKILYQTFDEFMQKHYTNLPENWKGVLDEKFFIKKIYQEKYPNLFYWITDDTDYLELLYERA